MEPIVIEFEVDCSPEHAFRMWTERTAMWWPPSHTVTGDFDLEVVFEPRAGGRIYERGPDGAEHEWDEVRVWDPPNRVEYLWHLFFDRSEGTDITLTFDPVGGGTRVRLHQDGFDRLPDDIGGPRRDRTKGAWTEITSLYREALLYCVSSSAYAPSAMDLSTYVRLPFGGRRDLPPTSGRTDPYPPPSKSAKRSISSSP